MKKTLYLFLTLIFISSLCFPKRKSDSIVLVKNPYTIEDINKLNISFQSGKGQSLETLIAISKDKNQELVVIKSSSGDVVGTLQLTFIPILFKLTMVQ